MRFSTGAVRDYVPNGCGGPDLPATIPEARGFAAVFQMAGHQLFSHWENRDVWGSDFRETGGGDLEPQGGSDLVELYFFTGHGICQRSPQATDPDFLVVCGRFGQPNVITIGKEIRWGNSRNGIQYAVIDASCPMDLVSLANSWFPVFQGMHIALGHSGNLSADTLDSADRGIVFAIRATGAFWFFPHQSVGDAWMDSGTIDIQSGCSAVALAAGESRSDAIWRRDNETIGVHSTFNFTPAWFAWKWRTR
ncbi:DUF6345 domain-containing protein [Streptomyces sp. NPDC059070]|uniref:DUF6345 domain-containing protein n=1 Tax=unclassified Streptomyces TaxID=2593676 RepID=UPI0034E24F6D